MPAVIPAEPIELGVAAEAAYIGIRDFGLRRGEQAAAETESAQCIALELVGRKQTCAVLGDAVAPVTDGRAARIVGDADVGERVVRNHRPPGQDEAGQIEFEAPAALRAGVDREQRIGRVGAGDIGFLDVEGRERRYQPLIEQRCLDPGFVLRRLLGIECFPGQSCRADVLERRLRLGEIEIKRHRRQRLDHESNRGIEGVRVLFVARTREWHGGRVTELLIGLEPFEASTEADVDPVTPADAVEQQQRMRAGVDLVGLVDLQREARERQQRAQCQTGIDRIEGIQRRMAAQQPAVVLVLVVVLVGGEQLIVHRPGAAGEEVRVDGVFGTEGQIVPFEIGHGQAACDISRGWVEARAGEVEQDEVRALALGGLTVH